MIGFPKLSLSAAYPTAERKEASIIAQHIEATYVLASLMVANAAEKPSPAGANRSASEAR